MYKDQHWCGHWTAVSYMLSRVVSNDIISFPIFLSHMAAIYRFTMPIQRISILPCPDFQPKDLLWSLCCIFVLHAGALIIDKTTWSMHHVGQNHLVKNSICLWVWEFRRYCLINIIWIDPVLMFLPQQDVCMWKSSLLILNGLSKDVLLFC